MSWLWDHFLRPIFGRVADVLVAAVRWVWSNPVAAIGVAIGFTALAWVLEDITPRLADLLDRAAEYTLYTAVVSLTLGYFLPSTDIGIDVPWWAKSIYVD